MISILVIAAILFLLSRETSMPIWLLCYSLFLCYCFIYKDLSLIAQMLLFLGFAIIGISTYKPWRIALLTRPIFTKMRPAISAISQTERDALMAGTVGWEGEIFTGFLDFDSLLHNPKPLLSAEEQAFIDGPVNELCRLIDDWQITHELTDLPASLWTFIKKNGFLGMIIPKNYGGLEFSALAHTAILGKIYGRSISVATTISVPNSLGPAELLLKYGTAEQKDFYLPRLADGSEIPCFALTGPIAGSDAASIPDEGIVCKKLVNNKEVMGIQLNWDKRYITLCPVATVIGLAFRLFDPENYLGKGKDVGISCALIPANTPGVIHGRRHFPLNTAFLNGPTQGKDVFIPLDYLIGGAELAGSGWKMLMECLSAGRAISLPSSALGGTQAACLASGAYARVRKQFNQPIGKFEGITAVLARIVRNTYIVDAALTMTAAIIDQGAKPAIAGAILKYHTTEFSRQTACDSMDIHGGKGICLGPKNYLGRGYQNAPISITVEGANILTRNLIIFGQGVVRCHPYLFTILESIRNNEIDAFNTALWEHFAFTLKNGSRSLILSWSDAYLVSAPQSRLKRYYQLAQRYSSHFAFLTDICLAVFGGNLKRKESISARLGDMLSYLYLLSGVLKRWESDGACDEDEVIASACCQQLLFETEKSMIELLQNLPYIIRWPLKVILLSWGRRYQPSDPHNYRTASLITAPTAARARLTRFVFKESSSNCPLGQLESAFQAVCSIAPLEKKISKAVKSKILHALTFEKQVAEALSIGLLNAEEAAALHQVEQLRQQVIAVDDFSDNDLRRKFRETITPKKG